MIMDGVEQNSIVTKLFIQQYPTFLLFSGAKNYVEFVWPARATILHEQETLIYIIQQHRTLIKMMANHIQQVEFNKVEYRIRIRFAI